MFQNWAEDQNDKAELEKYNAYIIGSFINPKAAKELIKGSSDDFSRTSSDKDFEEALNIVRNGDIEEPTIKRKRRRKLKA